MKYSTLSNKQLLIAYEKARNLNLDKNFIQLLKKEIELRKLPVK